jgi:hypothetical protein
MKIFTFSIFLHSVPFFIPPNPCHNTSYTSFRYHRGMVDFSQPFAFLQQVNLYLKVSFILLLLCIIHFSSLSNLCVIKIKHNFNVFNSFEDCKIDGVLPDKCLIEDVAIEYQPVIDVQPAFPCHAFSSLVLVGGCADVGDPLLICLKRPSWSVVVTVNDLALWLRESVLQLQSIDSYLVVMFQCLIIISSFIPAGHELRFAPVPHNLMNRCIPACA